MPDAAPDPDAPLDTTEGMDRAQGGPDDAAGSPDGNGPDGDRGQGWRSRLSRRGELLLAAFPVATILAVLGTVEAVSDQHVLFGSLAGSAFLIYLDPEHPTNSVRTLALSHATAALAGTAAHGALGAGVAAMSAALAATVAVMILADAVHPPAAGTALAFALRDEWVGAFGLFALAVGMVAVLVVVEVVLLRVFRRLVRSGRFRADGATADGATADGAPGRSDPGGPGRQRG